MTSYPSPRRAPVVTRASGALWLALALTTGCEAILGLRDTTATHDRPASGNGGNLGNGESVTGLDTPRFVAPGAGGSTKAIDSGGRGGGGADGGGTGEGQGGGSAPSGAGERGASTSGGSENGGAFAAGGRSGEGGREAIRGSGSSGAGSSGAAATTEAGGGGGGAVGGNEAGMGGLAGTAGTGPEPPGPREGGPIAGFDSTCLAIAETDGSATSDSVVVHRSCDELNPTGLWRRDEDGRLLAGVQGASLESTSEAGDPGAVVRVSPPIVPAATHQQWDLVNVHLKNSSGLCMDVPWGDFFDGAPVQGYECHDGASQEWTITPVGQIRHGAHCLDVSNGNTEAGTPMVVFSCQESPPDTQRFALAHGRIQPRNSGKCVGVAGILSGATAPLEIQNCADAGDHLYAQAFALIGPIMNRGLCLDISTPSIIGPVALQPCTGAPKQTWVWYF